MSWHQEYWVGSIILEGTVLIEPGMFEVQDNIVLVDFPHLVRELDLFGLSYYLLSLRTQSPYFHLVEDLVLVRHLFGGLGVLGFLDFLYFILRSHSEDKVVAVGDEDEIVGYLNGSTPFVVSEHRENVDASFGLEMVEALVIHIAEYKVLWTGGNSVV